MGERVAMATPSLEAAPASSRAAKRPLPVIVIDGKVRWAQWWKDLFLYRGALVSLARRNFRSRYRQAGLGAAWALIQPAAQVALFTYLFAIKFKVPAEGAPYPLFALSGLLLWNMFQKIISEGAVSLVSNQHLITKLFFPRIYLVLASGASALVDVGVTSLLLGGLFWYYGVVPTAATSLAVVALVGALLLSFGLAAMLAAVNARWRDVQHTIPFLLMLGLFVTPILYQGTSMGGRWKWVLALNPLTAFVELFRGALLGTPMPGRFVLYTSLAVSVLSVVAGLWLFRRSEATIVDVV